MPPQVEHPSVFVLVLELVALPVAPASADVCFSHSSEFILGLLNLAGVVLLIEKP